MWRFTKKGRGGRMTIGTAIKLTGVNRSTLKLHFRTLVERCRLEKHGKGLGGWYEAK